MAKISNNKGTLLRAVIILTAALSISACSHLEYEFDPITLDRTSVGTNVTNIRAEADRLLTSSGNQAQTRFRNYDAPTIFTSFALASNTLFSGGENASLGLGLVGTLFTGLRGYDQTSAWRQIYGETALSLYCIAEEISPFATANGDALRENRNALEAAVRAAEVFDFPPSATSQDRSDLANSAAQGRAAIALLNAAIGNLRDANSRTVLVVRNLEYSMITRVDTMGSNPSELINALQSYGGAIAEDSNLRIVASGGRGPATDPNSEDPGENFVETPVSELDSQGLALRIFELSRAATDDTAGLTTLDADLRVCVSAN